MDFLSRFALSRSRLTVLAMIAVMAAGLLSFHTLPKREDPEINARSPRVSASFEGLSPERVEDLIAVPLERAAREIPEVEDITTRITTGSAVLTLEVSSSVPNAGLDQVFQDIRNRMATVTLPEGAAGPFVSTDFADVAIATVAVTGDGFSYREIHDIAEDLRTHLYRVDGITTISLLGGQKEQIYLEIDSRRLAAVGVQINQLLADLTAQNVVLPAGQLDAAGVTLTLEANGDLTTVEEIGGLQTRVAGTDSLIRLDEVLTVRRGYVDPSVKPVFFNGEPAVIVATEMDSAHDLQVVGRELRREVRLFERTQPIGISFRFSTDQETEVTTAINGALLNVVQTFATVVVVLILFAGLRPALATATIVPFTVMFTLLGMQFAGVSIEQVSIAGVIISLGLLVDNGVVIVEDIQRRLQIGDTARAAALAAGRQFVVPLAVASLTTASSFIPMFLLDGVSGDFAFSLGAVVCLMLLGSWLSAHYFLPYLATVLLREPKAPVISKSVDQDGFAVQVYGRLVRAAVGSPALVLIAVYAVMVIGAVNFGGLRNEMFPLSERAEYLVYMDLPHGSSTAATLEEALRVDDWLRDPNENPEVLSTTLYVGDGGPRFNLGVDPAEPIASSAFFLVNASDPAGAAAASARARGHLAGQFPAARFRVTRIAMGGAESGIVEVHLSGPEGDALLGAAREIEALFHKIPGIGFFGSDWGNKIIRVIVDIDQNKARELGVTSRDISDVLETYFTGSTHSTFREGSTSIPIVLRADEVFRNSLEDLAAVTLQGNGRLLSIDQVARYRPTFDFAVIRRHNQERRIIIEGKSSQFTASELLGELRTGLDAIVERLGPGYRLTVGGETERSAEAYSGLAAGLPYALLVMLVALTFQFNSVRRVLLTLMTVPLVLAGAPLGLALTGQPLSLFAILGLISLIGIIINNAIVLIDQIDIEREFSEVPKAIENAARKRLKPIALTTATTVLGLLPMALFGGPLFEPMAALMIGGLLLATPLSLLLVPATYSWFLGR